MHLNKMNKNLQVLVVVTLISMACKSEVQILYLCLII